MNFDKTRLKKLFNNHLPDDGGGGGGGGGGAGDGPRDVPGDGARDGAAVGGTYISTLAVPKNKIKIKNITNLFEKIA